MGTKVIAWFRRYFSRDARAKRKFAVAAKLIDSGLKILRGETNG